jgi:hypothetical protein
MSQQREEHQQYCWRVREAWNQDQCFEQPKLNSLYFSELEVELAEGGVCKV